MNDLRISYIDQLKGIAILLVVLGHVIGYNNCEDSFLWRFIYSFHMPLFMFISGYVAQMTFRIERFGWNGHCYFPWLLGELLSLSFS